MRIVCKISFVDLENDDGLDIESVEAFCPRCHHSTESFGTHSGSIARCLALMREECPYEEKNWYVSDLEEE
jgi:hypothetical protein